MKQMTIDRFEGDIAVCELDDLSTIDVKRSELPAEAKQGDILVEVDGSWQIDSDATDERATRIKKKMDDIFED